LRALHLTDEVVRALPFADENHRRWLADLTMKSLKIIVTGKRKALPVRAKRAPRLENRIVSIDDDRTSARDGGQARANALRGL